MWRSSRERQLSPGDDLGPADVVEAAGHLEERFGGLRLEDRIAEAAPQHATPVPQDERHAGGRGRAQDPHARAHRCRQLGEHREAGPRGGVMWSWLGYLEPYDAG